MQTLFSRSPWERSAVVPLRNTFLGQAGESCTITPEGVQICPVGGGDPTPIEIPLENPTPIEKPLLNDFPVIPVAVGVLVVTAVGAFLLS